MSKTKTKNRMPPPPKPAEGWNTLYSKRQLEHFTADAHAAKRTDGWCKLLVHVKDQRDLIIAMPLARAIWTLDGAQVQGLYFARYTNKPGPRIEYHVRRTLINVEMDQALMDYIKLICRKAGLKVRVGIQACEGSLPHAWAFRIACALEDKDLNTLNMVSDVAHWISNMLGFTYAQEAESHLRAAHLCMTNVLGYVEQPVFANPFVVYRRALEAKEALKAMEASKRNGKQSKKVTESKK